MTRHLLFAVASLSFILSATTAAGQTNWITSWGDGTLDEEWSIDQFAAEIRILRANGNTYKFYAEDPPGSPGTGVINNITVDPNAAGDFSLLIAYPLDPNDPNSPVDPNEAGALDWNEGNLTYAGGTSTVTGVKVAGLLSEPGKPIHIDRLDGSIDVGESVWMLGIDEWVSPPPTFVHIGGDAASLTLWSGCAADILVDGNMWNLTLHGDLCGTLDIGGQGSASISGSILGRDGWPILRGAKGGGAILF